MVLTKEEFVLSLQEEVRILLHLAEKIDLTKLDYRPTPKQRSTLELLQYMAIAAPIQIAVFKAGVFTRAALMAAWGSTQEAAKSFTFEQCIAAIQKQGEDFESTFSDWTEASFREQLNLFGNKNSRGFFLVNVVLSGFAAYRMQLFCYLKASGRDELNTANLWWGTDNFTPPD
jgi:hypothetical protein